ncbi:MAG TPA: hypothetical protein VED84_07115, partial [Acidimicrobiales bacterium]|nr:hypothetical protein [Acidimicrobiales bacterium]
MFDRWLEDRWGSPRLVYSVVGAVMIALAIARWATQHNLWRSGYWLVIALAAVIVVGALEWARKELRSRRRSATHAEQVIKQTERYEDGRLASR